MKTIAIHQPECFPWLGFIDKALKADVFVLLDDVQFKKNNFQNRNKIRTARGWSWVTVPVAITGHSGSMIKDMKVSPSLEPWWRRKQRESWRQAYSRSPFASRIMPFIEELYDRPWDDLLEFNLRVIEKLFDEFGVEARVVRSSEVGSEGSSSSRLVSLCRALGATSYLSGSGGRGYLDERLFNEAGIAVEFRDFHHPVYRQGRREFIPGMTAFDMLFNVGPEAGVLLKEGAEPQRSRNNSHSGCVSC